MKKIAYIAPTTEVTTINTHWHILAGSPTKTNVDDLPISEDPAPEEMEGHSRRRTVWDDEEEQNY